ncbi:MAG: NAD(P)/FAD-dependent oxidoreductase [Betaproteobacteria bacterium]|nr:MAG: NAD(P)/FAD-dependent oxidoreductase [Betaproteobacteria bacterium]
MTDRLSAQRYDVIIMGGGLAGLCLALQLRKSLPALDILIVERRRHPVAAATHKVGESTVEIAANYFDTVLGLKDHLVSKQLKKFGFRFFFSDGREDVDRVTEIGASHYLSTPSYQLDRGIFENFLGEAVRRDGIDFRDDAIIRQFELRPGPDEHSITYQRGNEQHTATARWLIDATGRAELIKRRLGLGQENGHDANAVWFRIGARITIDEWSDDPAWRNRCTPPARWLSTNHLVGDGYWAWLIPLSSGSHSVGIVADSRIHPSTSLDSFEKVLTWLDKHQPRLARELRDKQDLLQDFKYLRSFSYGCKQIFSEDRWALSGESGVFLDPFYSPGSDFIAIANTYITDLIARDHSGQSIGALTRVYERFFNSFYESTLSLYKNQYTMFGNLAVFPLKIIWDYTYYWGILCQLFFQRKLTDIGALSSVSGELERCKALNFAMQAFLNDWSKVGNADNLPMMIDHASLDWFAELNRGLRDELDDVEFVQRIAASSKRLQMLALEMVTHAQSKHIELDSTGISRIIDATLSESDAASMLAWLPVPDRTQPRQSTGAHTLQ